MSQLQGLDSSLEKAVEAYDLANVRLAGIQRDLRRNGFELGVARSNLSRAQKTLQQRLVAVYTAGGPTRRSRCCSARPASTTS